MNASTSLGHAPSRTPGFFTPSEFRAHFPHVGRDAIYRLIKEKRIKTVRLFERKYLIPASELYDWPQREMERA